MSDVEVLKLVRALLALRGTDVSELEREIVRLRSLQGRPDLAASAGAAGSA
jgi:hypothetical protein